MDEAAKRFARKILLLHLVLLLAVISVALMGGREVYMHARSQALHQAQEREELVAAQTASGIESYYTSILANLDLDKRTAGDPLMPKAHSPLEADLRSRLTSRILWHQLEDRALGLFSVDLTTMKVQRPPEEPLAQSEQNLLDANKDWLASLQGPAISEPRPYQKGNVVLLANPLLPMGRTLVAIVPVSDVDRRFFTAPDRFNGLSVGLLDDQGHAIVASDESFVPVATAPAGSALRRFLHTYLGKRAGTEAIASTGTAGFAPSIVSMQPLNLPGVHWSVIVRSSLADTDLVLTQLFGRLVFWGIFLLAALIVIFASTAMLTIRGRLRLERMEHELLTREMAQARQIQLAWLPDPRKNAGPFSIAAINQPASHISGDFYNWFDLPDGRHAIVIGDVTGHGMAAAFLMATTQLLIRAALTRTCDPGKSLEMVNNELCVQAFRGQFVTLLIAVLDVKEMSIAIATAGHPAPLLGNAQGFEPIEIEPQLMLGVEAQESYPTHTFPLSPGATLVLYTDGVVEAENANGVCFTADALRRVLQSARPDPEGLAEGVVDAVRNFSRGQDLTDDLTLVAVAIASSPAPRRMTEAART